LGGRVDWRILPNVVIGGGITYLQDEYQGALAFGRIDRTLSPLASLKYLINTNLTAGFDFRRINFISGGGIATPPFVNVNAIPYNRDVYLFSLNGKF
jgi:hypothetical protein